MYLLDVNTLIEAKNRHYRMTVCPGYWDWLQHAHAQGEIASIVSVRNELQRGNDSLAVWAKDHLALFWDESDDATQAAFATVAQYVASQAHLMKAGALNEFLDGADPWLIAKAMAIGATVVTHEQFKPDVRKKFLIPNVCQNFNVPYMDTFDLLSRLEAKFVLA